MNLKLIKFNYNFVFMLYKRSVVYTGGGAGYNNITISWEGTVIYSLIIILLLAQYDTGCPYSFPCKANGVHFCYCNRKLLK